MVFGIAFEQGKHAIAVPLKIDVQSRWIRGAKQQSVAKSIFIGDASGHIGNLQKMASIEKHETKRSRFYARLCRVDGSGTAGEFVSGKHLAFT
jgi:hypothetical protein